MILKKKYIKQKHYDNEKNTKQKHYDPEKKMQNTKIMILIKNKISKIETF